jgi:hypothetical protein
MKPGDWLQLGRYGKKKIADEILWRCTTKTTFISAHVIADQDFDDPRRAGLEHGDNRWKECTLRLRLNSDEGLMSRFLPKERAALAVMKLKTEVLSSYGVDRPRSVDTTEDRVWVASWDEYKKLPVALRKAVPSKGYRRDHPKFKLPIQPHWSRTPLDGLGCALLDLWFTRKDECNSGADCDWGLRPLIALQGGVELTGKGTEKQPYRLAQ